MGGGRVAEALVAAAGGRGGGHRCGRREGVLRSRCEEAGMFGVFGPGRHTEVHLVRATQECTTWGAGVRGMVTMAAYDAIRHGQM